MPNIESLEKYLDILFEDKNFNENHSLSDDKKRFDLYQEIKVKLNNLSDKLNEILLKVSSSKIKNLSYNFNLSAKYSDDELDNAIKKYAVEEVLIKAEDSNANIKPIIDYIFKDINGEDANIIASDNNKIKNEIISFNQENISDKIASIIFYIDNLEIDLVDSKLGVIAKDKKMIKILRSMQVLKSQSVSKELHGSRVRPKKSITKRKDIFERDDKEIS